MGSHSTIPSERSESEGLVPSERSESRGTSKRRQFLTSGVGLAGLVMGAVRSLRGQTATPDARPKDLLAYGQALQHEALLDGTSAFIVHAHAVKTSVAATHEALRIGSSAPLDATARFMAAPKLERFVAATVTRSIDFLSGKAPRD